MPRTRRTFTSTHSTNLSREPAVAKQLTSTSGFKNWAQFSPDNKEIFFIENGRIGVVNLEGRSRSLAVTAEMDVDFSREKMEVFRQGWSYLRDFFYDPELSRRKLGSRAR